MVKGAGSKGSTVQMSEGTLLSRAAMYSGAGCSLHKGTQAGWGRGWGGEAG